MRKGRIIGLILLFGGGCGSDPSPISDFNGAIQVGGVSRTYFVHPPVSYDPQTPLPVLIAFHGSPGSGASLRALTGLDSIADQLGFLVAYPDADGSWQDGRPGFEGSEDFDFVGLLLDSVNSRVEIDRRRVHLAGFSLGGLFIARLACERGNLMTGITVVAATLTDQIVGSCNLQVPTPVHLMIGKADLAFPWDGSLEYLSVPVTMQTWSSWNGCGPIAVSELIRLPYSDTTIARSTYLNCRGGGEVALYPLENTAHTWPTGTIDAGYLAGSAAISQRR
jgi:polyhydroxybutyrate depolymerase